MALRVTSTVSSRILCPTIYPLLFHTPRVMKSTLIPDKIVEIFFEKNKVVSIPPKGWSERAIIIADKQEPKLEKEQQKMPQFSTRSPLSFDEYKKQRLKTFDDYKALHEKYYDIETIQKGYESYCQGRYQSYLIELEQINPGIIL